MSFALIAVILTTFFMGFFYDLDRIAFDLQRPTYQEELFLLTKRQFYAEHLCSPVCPDGAVIVPNQPIAAFGGRFGTVSTNGNVISYFVAGTPATGRNLLASGPLLTPNVLSAIGTYSAQTQTVTGVPFISRYPGGSMTNPAITTSLAGTAVAALIPDQSIVLLEHAQ